MDEARLKIKFYTRSFDKELYSLSRSLYQMAGYPCVRLTDQRADSYFYTMLQDLECDIAINVDEDCFISDLDAVIRLADSAWKNGLVNIGCSDAGKGIPRSGDKEVTNPFFNIFNLKKIRESWSPSIISALTADSLHKPEPYYGFFLWTLKAFPDKTRYLRSERHHDGLSTILYDDSGHLLCSHSWFARQYHPSLLTLIFEGNDVKEVNHSKRIKSLIHEVYTERGLKVPDFSLDVKIGFTIDRTVRWSIKIPQRLRRLPGKLRQKLNLKNNCYQTH